MLIDIHCHFDMLEGTPEEILKRAQAAGVEKMITIGTEPSDHQYVLDVSAKLYPDVYCTLGIHPHHGSVWTEEAGAFIEKHLADPQVVAIGEIGLDYHYNQSPVEEQKFAFRKQLDLAQKYKMPVQIHTRDAEEDTAAILEEYRGKVTGVIHCFTSSEWLARRCLDLGYNISFSGIVTFKSAHDLQAVCQFVPLDRLHVETDAPFLTPVPLRGQKNTPANVVHTAEKVAQLKGITIDELKTATKENARRLFPKIRWDKTPTLETPQ